LLVTPFTGWACAGALLVLAVETGTVELAVLAPESDAAGAEVPAASVVVVTSALAESVLEEELP